MPRPFKKNLAVALALLALCAFAGFAGLRATADLTWPPGQDFSRDVAVAETIAHGQPLSDPFYRGEWAWYNPLVPGLVAALSLSSHQPVHIVYARAGAYLNLLAPICLFVFMAVTFDRVTALAAVVGFLFCLPGSEPTWSRATYSPWLVPAQFVQALSYLALLSIAHAYREQRFSWWAVAGAATGLVFLGHAAPAAILAGLVTILCAGKRYSQQAGRTRTFAHWLLYAAVAALVATPLLSSIVGHYHLVMLNRFPADFVEPSLDVRGLGRFLRDELTPTTGGVIATIGIVRLMTLSGSPGPRVVLAGAATTLILFAYSYATQYAMREGLWLPALVPGWHFLFYLRAFEAMAFGVGATTVADAIASVSARARVRPLVSRGTSRAVVFAGLVAWAAISYPSYLQRPDFTSERRAALRMFDAADLVAMHDWIQRSTSTSDVFLAPDNLGLSVIAAAGRKLVAVDRFFSNPYVDWRQRTLDRDRMVELLAQGEWSEFFRLASSYRVRYVATNGPALAAPGASCCLRQVWTSGPWRLYLVGSS